MARFPRSSVLFPQVCVMLDQHEDLALTDD